MQTIFVMVKCELGKAYDVADDAVAVEQVSEVYSTSGQYDLLMKCYLDEKTDIGHFVDQPDPDAAGREGHLHPDHLQGVFLSTALPHQHLPRGEDFLLLPPSIQPYAYRMRRQPVRPSRDPARPDPRELPRGTEIAPVYRADGREHDVASFMDRNVIVGILVIHRGRDRAGALWPRPAGARSLVDHVDRQVDDGDAGRRRRSGRRHRVDRRSADATISRRCASRPMKA